MPRLDRVLPDALSAMQVLVASVLATAGCGGESAEPAVAPPRQRWSHRGGDAEQAMRRAAALQADVRGAGDDRAQSLARFDALEACARSGAAPSGQLRPQPGDPWQNEALLLAAAPGGGSVEDWRKLLQGAEDREDPVAAAWCRANLGFAMLSSASSLEGPDGLRTVEKACEEFAASPGVAVAALDEAACHAYRARFLPADRRREALDAAERALGRLRADAASVCASPGSFLGMQPVGRRIAYVIDVSDSMKPSMDAVRAAVRASVCSLPPGSAWAIVAFNDRAIPMAAEDGAASDRGMVPVVHNGAPAVGAADAWLSGLVPEGESVGVFDAISSALELAPSSVIVLTDRLPRDGADAKRLAGKVDDSGVPVMMMVTDVARERKANVDVANVMGAAQSIAGTRGALVLVDGSVADLAGSGADAGWSGVDLVEQLGRAGRWTPELERQRALVRAQLVLQDAAAAAIASGVGAGDLSGSTEANKAFEALGGARPSATGADRAPGGVTDWQGESLRAALANALGSTEADGDFAEIARAVKDALDRVPRESDPARHDALRELCARAHLLSALCASPRGAPAPFAAARDRAHADGVLEGTWSGMLLQAPGGWIARRRAAACAGTGPDSATRLAELAAVLRASGSSAEATDASVLGHLYRLPPSDADVLARAARRAEQPGSGTNP
jgi:hypothetical protein